MCMKKKKKNLKKKHINFNSQAKVKGAKTKYLKNKETNKKGFNII